jgi:hypothetical protein
MFALKQDWSTLGTRTACGLLEQRFSTGVPRDLEEDREKREKSWGIKRSLNSTINIICKNNTMIRILAIELWNIILLLVFLMTKSLLKNWWCALTILAPCSVCAMSWKKVEKLCARVSFHSLGYVMTLGIHLKMRRICFRRKCLLSISYVFAAWFTLQLKLKLELVWLRDHTQ